MRRAPDAAALRPGLLREGEGVMLGGDGDPSRQAGSSAIAGQGGCDAGVSRALEQ